MKSLVPIIVSLCLVPSLSFACPNSKKMKAETDDKKKNVIAEIVESEGSITKSPDTKPALASAEKQ
ncbi:hypothetical protein [Pseudobacteriovorax antillogorgiicola]|uniref:Lipoprotein n=1 Tax=Pseudobacteriovorax antillogorgiicola TaxID=1513793 RepID=A0A1Y6BEF1_9BACT|nr:hypothetical protein [Pseudobacteriovorax antillogorgiicola]TCS56453.1 hypothetical protein EDD56_104275 [Pseudobacteriovorax antillogorgiicola]SMF05278.1 hypothetical protein SAMN06296036_10458 [Pseudobacteriovorax antillogorgiicola]